MKLLEEILSLELEEKTQDIIENTVQDLLFPLFEELREQEYDFDNQQFAVHFTLKEIEDILKSKDDLTKEQLLIMSLEYLGIFYPLLNKGIAYLTSQLVGGGTRG